MSLKEELQNLVDSLKDAALDLATLDVITLSGDITLALDDDQKKFKKPFEIAKQFYGNTEGKINVEAFTHIDFDQDKIQFFKTGLKETDLTYKLHQEAVEASQEARNAFLDFIKEIID